jgi:hypothetical protein
MSIETAIRILAIGKTYWSSLYNIADFGVLLLCFVCFGLILNSECGDGKSTEAVAESLLLIVRNVVQFIRLGTMLKKCNKFT